MRAGIIAASTALGLSLLTGMIMGSSTVAAGGQTLPATESTTAAPGANAVPTSEPATNITTIQPVALPPIPKPQKQNISIASVTPSADGTYGVGVIPTIRFSEPVPENARWAVQENLLVSVTPALSEPLIWSWVDAETLALRPKEFWPQKHEVSITSTWPTGKALIQVAPDEWKKKKPVPPSKTIAVRISDNVDISFRIGREQIFTINAKNYSGTVTRNGKEILDVPISLGKSGWETASGVKTLMEFYEVKKLQNLTGPETWSVDAPYSIRLTWSGEFLHSATWNGSIGYAHTSHGCTNLTLDDARWFYENGLRGDPVITKNTGMGYRGAWDGDGAPWNVDWETWKANSATAP